MLSYIKTKLKNQIIRLKDWRDAYYFNRYKDQALIPFDENWFKGKRVAIIGGADSAYKEKLGEFIDSFDVVVRVNNGVRVLEKSSEYVGTRTDILFHSFYTINDGGQSPIEINLWKNKCVKNVVFSYHVNDLGYGRKYSSKFLRETKGRIVFSCVPFDQMIKNLLLVNPFTPTTGIIAINTVLNCNPSEIYVTGITFFRTAHHDGYRQGDLGYWLNKINSAESNHNPEAEYQAFKKMYNNNRGIFSVDNTLLEILNA